ncbi:MAG TPA: hypothetical protein VGK67_18490 [Myxococcales bacterium]|jgi:hypothetical protein
MTLSLPVLAALLLAAAPSAKPAPEPGQGKFAAGEAAFGKGEFDKAIAQLDLAVRDAEKANADPMLTKIHLLRGQCFAGMSNNAKATEAFLKALESDPAAALNPSAVRPSTIALLDKARAEAKGELKATGDGPAEVYLDDQKLGPVPFTGPVAIGKHQVQSRGPDGRSSGKQEIVVHANRPVEVALTLQAPAVAPPPPPPVEPEPKPEGGSGVDYFADLRLAPQFRLNPGSGTTFAGELGVGVGLKYVNVSAHAGFAGKNFAATFRLTGRLPELASIVGLHVSLDVPTLLVNNALVFGVGGSLGVDLAATRWIEPFLDLGFRHYLAVSGVTTDTNSLHVGLGARLRLP